MALWGAMIERFNRQSRKSFDSDLIDQASELVRTSRQLIASCHCARRSFHETMNTTYAAILSSQAQIKQIDDMLYGWGSMASPLLK
jgi:hypothetical protein